MKKRVLVIALVLSLLVPLTGCKAPATTPNGATPTPETATSPY